jgi:hypothetical protein
MAIVVCSKRDWAVTLLLIPKVDSVASDSTGAGVPVPWSSNCSERVGGFCYIQACAAVADQDHARLRLCTRPAKKILLSDTLRGQVRKKKDAESTRIAFMVISYPSARAVANGFKMTAATPSPRAYPPAAAAQIHDVAQWLCILSLLSPTGSRRRLWPDATATPPPHPTRAAGRRAGRGLD